MQPKRMNLDELFVEEVLRARKMTPEQKLGAGYELFVLGCEIARAGIRAQFPGSTEEEVELHLRRRFAIAERLETVRIPPAAIVPHDA